MGQQDMGRPVPRLGSSILGRKEEGRMMDGRLAAGLVGNCGLREAHRSPLTPPCPGDGPGWPVRPLASGALGRINAESDGLAARPGAGPLPNPLPTAERDPLLGSRVSLGYAMARAGIEPATPRFSVVCSTN